MAAVRVVLRECDVKGAILPCSVVEDNQIVDLKRWIVCRGFTAGKSESKLSLVRRIKDLTNSGMSRYVCDPDGDAVKSYLTDIVDVPLPHANKWSDDLSCIPYNFNHSCVVEYLVHRKIKIVSKNNDSDSEEEYVNLPTAQKPLRKGYNFYASGHVDEVKTNICEKVIHVWAKVLSSYKENKYDTKTVFDSKTGDIVRASCSCVAGKGEKCNHIAGLLFHLLDFNHALQHAPESCTSKGQQWHKPPRKSKRFTRPVQAGERKLQRHEFGRVVKRKRPLEDYRSYNVLSSESSSVSQTQLFKLKRDLDHIKKHKHDSGLTQILNSSTDTASEGEETANDKTDCISLTPEERVMEVLQVTEVDQKLIEEKTRGQANNVLWHREKKGRITASNAKRCCGKATAPLLKTLITVGKPSHTSVPSLLYGVQNEDTAANMYLADRKAKGHDIFLKNCGLFVDIKNGQLGASPDRLVCNCEGKVIGLLEIKCMYSCKDISPYQAVLERQGKGEFCLKNADGQYKLKEKHAYFYQVQMQMAVCNLPWCDFVLFTNSTDNIITCRVHFDSEFWDGIRENLLKLHEDNVLPALVAQGYCQK